MSDVAIKVEVPKGDDDDVRVSVVSLYQKQNKIYARAVSGWFAGWRWALVWITQLVFYGLPWLDWGSRQAVLFDLGSRRFYIFGLVLYPQDFIYLTGLLTRLTPAATALSPTIFIKPISPNRRTCVPPQSSTE